MMNVFENNSTTSTTHLYVLNVVDPTWKTFSALHVELSFVSLQNDEDQCRLHKRVAGKHGNGHPCVTMAITGLNHEP